MEYALQQRNMDGDPLTKMSIRNFGKDPYIEITMLDNNERYEDGGIISVGVYVGMEKIRERTLTEKELVASVFGVDYEKFKDNL